AVVRRVKTLDRKHDIPYLAGYSKDGKTIYIDRHMPSSFRYSGKDINTDRYLILHEKVEKTLIDQLNLHYLHAHQIATCAEQAAVRAAGIRWRRRPAASRRTTSTPRSAVTCRTVHIPRPAAKGIAERPAVRPLSEAITDFRFAGQRKNSQISRG